MSLWRWYYVLPQGCSAPLVVKIADTDKEKAQRRLQQAMTTLGNQFGGMNNLTALSLGLGMNPANAYYQQMVGGYVMEIGHLPNGVGLSPCQLLQQLQQQAGQGTPAASNSFGLGTAGTVGLAYIV